MFYPILFYIFSYFRIEFSLRKMLVLSKQKQHLKIMYSKAPICSLISSIFAIEISIPIKSPLRKDESKYASPEHYF